VIAEVNDVDKYNQDNEYCPEKVELVIMIHC